MGPIEGNNRISNRGEEVQGKVGQTSKGWYAVATLVALVALGGIAFGGAGIMHASGFALPSFIPQVMMSAFKTLGYGGIAVAGGGLLLSALAVRVAYVTCKERKHQKADREEMIRQKEKQLEEYQLKYSVAQANAQKLLREDEDAFDLANLSKDDWQNQVNEDSGYVKHWQKDDWYTVIVVDEGKLKIAHGISEDQKDRLIAYFGTYKDMTFQYENKN